MNNLATTTTRVPYVGVRIACTYCVYEAHITRTPKPGAKRLPLATVVRGTGRAARQLCAQHAAFGTWRK